MLNKATEKTIPIYGSQCSAKIWGREGAPIILALHGWLDNAASFDLLAPYLEAFQVVALDLPGHGLSEHKPEGARYHFIEGVADVVDVIEHLTDDKIYLLGHSLGGALASLVAGVAPDKLHALLVIDALGPFSIEPGACPEFTRRALRKWKNRDLKQRKTYSSFEKAVEARQKAGDLTYESAEIMASRGTQAVSGGVVWRHDIRLTLPGLVRLTEAQVCAYLSAISVPTCMIIPSDGLALDPTVMQKRMQSVPDFKTVSLKGGHHLHMDSPAAVAQVVNDFFALPPKFV